ncbi:MAG: CHASE2 domain-containing protein [Candidatus Omnitrophica bacterium]|nr:CHASE2 domain-containing protein [Candidatus Omnitrophota bacterium]
MPKKKETLGSAPFEVHLASLRGRLLRNVLIGAFIAVIITLFGEIQMVKDGELLVYDWRMNSRPNRVNEAPITLVMIQDSSLNTTGIRGLDRPKTQYLAELIRVLDDKKAKVIGLDLVLADIGDEDPYRRELESSIHEAGNVILSGRTFGMPETKMDRVSQLPPAFLRTNAKGVGVQNLRIGDFGIVRDSLVRMKLTGDQTMNAFSVLVAQAYEGDNFPKTLASLHEGLWLSPFYAQAIPLNIYGAPMVLGPDLAKKVSEDPSGGVEEGFLAINYRGPRSSVGSFEGTFICLPGNLSYLQTLDNRFFENRIVIVGSGETNVRNRHPTPVSLVGGETQNEMFTAEILANMIATILDGDYVFFPTVFGRLGWLLAIGLVSGFVCTNRRLLPVTLLVLIFTWALYRYSNHLLVHSNVFLPTLPALAIPWLTLLGSIGARLALDDREIRLLRDTFGRSVSPAIAQELVTRITEEGGDGQKALLSEECVGSILFLDVANFTPLSESVSPERLFLFTNELLDRLAECVFDNQGSLIRYTGDGLIALFGRPIVREDHAILACEAGLAMQERLRLLNDERSMRGEPVVQIRIGINTGTMIVGLLGGQKRFDYSVLGNEVNVAARFEKLNKDFGTTILVGEPTIRETESKFLSRPLGSISLKGKTRQVSVYELVARSDDPLHEDYRFFLDHFNRGYVAIRNNQYEEAFREFSLAIRYRPQDLATQKLLARAKERMPTEPV